MKKLLIASKSQVASFDIDAQNCFTPLCPDELPVEEGHHIAVELNAQAAFAAFRLGSKDAHSPDAVWVASPENPMLTPLTGQKNVDLYWPQHAVPGTHGFAAIEGLPSPTEYDYYVWKGVELDLHPYGACFHDFQEKLSTGAIEFLKFNSVSTVIVGGLATDYCVKTTVLQLLRAGFKVILNLAACRGINIKTTQAAIAEMQAQGAMIIESANCLKNADEV